MCRRTEEEVGPTVGLPCHRHFVGFFNVPVLAPTRDHPFYTVIPTHRPIETLKEGVFYLFAYMVY